VIMGPVGETPACGSRRLAMAECEVAGLQDQPSVAHARGSVKARATVISPAVGLERLWSGSYTSAFAVASASPWHQTAGDQHEPLAGARVAVTPYRGCTSQPAEQNSHSRRIAHAAVRDHDASPSLVVTAAPDDRLRPTTAVSHRREGDAAAAAPSSPSGAGRCTQDSDHGRHVPPRIAARWVDGRAARSYDRRSGWVSSFSSTQLAVAGHHQPGDDRTAAVGPGTNRGFLSRPRGPCGKEALLWVAEAGRHHRPPLAGAADIWLMTGSPSITGGRRPSSIGGESAHRPGARRASHRRNEKEEAPALLLCAPGASGRQNRTLAQLQQRGRVPAVMKPALVVAPGTLTPAFGLS
jgi:hypothetical protein